MSLAVIIGFSGCSPSTVAEGEEAVLVYQPLFFGEEGVDPKPIPTGLTWTAFTTKVIRVTLQPYKKDEIFDDLVTKDNNPVDFKLHLTLVNIEGETPILVDKFGVHWYENKVREPLRNITRDFTKDKTMFEMTTDKTISKKLELYVFDYVQSFLLKEKIPVKLLRVTVGKVMPPQKIIEATIETGVQKQRVKTQQERVKAENAREAAERASATADKAYMEEIGMTTQEYLRSRELDNQKEAINNGANVNIIMGNAQPFVNISNKR